MTAKQRAARAKFKAVVAEAKKLRKKNPKLTQAQAVKQAWAISYSKERGGTKLGAVKKSKYKVGDKVYRNYDSFKKSEPGKIIYVSYTAPYLYKLKLEDGFSNYLEENDISKKAKYKVSEMGAVKKKKAIKKKSATKVKAKKSRSTEMHTDTKSHNVNIRVISGIGNIGQKFTRISNDVNGNPRYVIHFLEVLNEEERTSIPFNKKYEYAVKKANKIGGKKYDNKSYGGGIVFQSYNIEKTYEDIQKIKNTTPKIRI